MKLSRTLIRRASLLALLAASGPVAVAAQTEPVSPTKTTSTPEDEVIDLADLVVTEEMMVMGRPTVTATKLPLSIRQTPQSISTVDRVTMQAESLFSVDDVLRGVTGVHVAFYDTQRPLYFARGFQITDFQVDGIPTYSGSTNQEYDTALYERIEVVRGANGLLSGAGVPSATVNLIRKRPRKEFEVSLAATYGNWDYYRGVADISAPVYDEGRVRTRFVIAAQDRESFRDRYADEKLAWLATAEADLTATTTLGVGYQYQENDPTNPMWGTVPRFAEDGSEANLPRSTSFSTNWTEWSRESGTAFVSLDQKLGENWLFRAAYNRTEGNTFSLRVYATGFPDLETGENIYLRAGIGETEDVRDNLDLYLSGKFELLGRTHDLVVGWNANWLDSDSPTFASITSGTYVWRYDIPDFRTFDGNAPMPTILKTGASRTTITDQTGFYGSLRLNPVEDLSLILGARVSDWETYVENYNTSGDYTGNTGAYEVSGEVTPYVGVVYDLNEVWSVYASYTDIFRPQNYKDKGNELLSPVLGANLEAGLKAEFFAGRFQVTASVFETKQDNYAVRDTSVPDNSLPDGSSAYMGVDGTKSQGVELELFGYVTKDWTMSLGYSYIDTERHPSDLTYANVPEDLLRFSTHYRLPGALQRLTLGTGVTWQGATEGVGIVHPTLGTTTVTQDSFFLVNVFANCRLTSTTTLSLSVRNALDETYWATLDYPNYGEPLSAQATLRWHY